MPIDSTRAMVSEASRDASRTRPCINVFDHQPGHAIGQRRLAPRMLGGLDGWGPFDRQPFDAMYERRMQHLWFGGYLDVGHPIA
jgi:hypothetical protein